MSLLVFSSGEWCVAARLCDEPGVTLVEHWLTGSESGVICSAMCSMLAVLSSTMAAVQCYTQYYNSQSMCCCSKDAVYK